MKIVKTAFVAFGEVNTPFEKLREKHDEALKLLAWPEAEIVDGGLVIDDPAYEYADKALAILEKEIFESLVVCVCGWIPSHTVIRITDQYRHLPIVLWGLSGWRENGKIVTTAEQAGTTALRPAFEDLGYQFKYVYNIIGKEPPLEKIRHYLTAASAYRQLRNKRIGTMGYRDMLLYGTQHEGVSLRAKIGVEVEPFEMLEMVQLSEKVDDQDVEKAAVHVQNNWKIVGEYDEKALRTGMRYALALKQKIEDRQFDALSLIDVDGMKKLLDYPPAVIFTYLSEHCGIPTIPENDMLGSVSQLIAKSLTEQIAPYVEFYEFFEKSVLAGVPDYIPVECTDGDVTLLSTSFGLLAKTFLNVSKLKTGTVTLSRLFYRNGRYYMHLLTAEAKAPPAWEEYGWTPPAPQLPSLELELSCPVEEFAQKVSGQHIILVYGDHSERFRDYCSLAGIEVV